MFRGQGGGSIPTSTSLPSWETRISFLFFSIERNSLVTCKSAKRFVLTIGCSHSCLLHLSVGVANACLVWAYIQVCTASWNSFSLLINYTEKSGNSNNRFNYFHYEIKDWLYIQCILLQQSCFVVLLLVVVYSVYFRIDRPAGRRKNCITVAAAKLCASRSKRNSRTLHHKQRSPDKWRQLKTLNVAKFVI
jgi:hypothetical protein